MSYQTETTKTTIANNRDPITDTPGAHPIGTGVGALIGGAAAGVGAGAAIGAATGTVVGPVGTLIGAAVGAVVGGLAGKGVAEAIDPTVEETYWRENYASRPYARGASFQDYGPAYQYGVNSYSKYEGRNFAEVESDLERDWHHARGNSKLDWNGARVASQDAWNRLSDRVDRHVPGDSHRDSK
jgi:hypothetical protein